MCHAIGLSPLPLGDLAEAIKSFVKLFCSIDPKH